MQIRNQAPMRWAASLCQLEPFLSGPLAPRMAHNVRILFAISRLLLAVAVTDAAAAASRGARPYLHARRNVRTGPLGRIDAKQYDVTVAKKATVSTYLLYKLEYP